MSYGWGNCGQGKEAEASSSDLSAMGSPCTEARWLLGEWIMGRQ